MDLVAGPCAVEDISQMLLANLAFSASSHASSGHLDNVLKQVMLTCLNGMQTDPHRCRDGEAGGLLTECAAGKGKGSEGKPEEGSSPSTPGKPNEAKVPVTPEKVARGAEGKSPKVLRKLTQ